ncbi:hypothetical protein I79_008832 [Cricetulus griseus]|uniref:Uncharacterized protein n=1 Tax=Cricetulus griseus TaxID=10029 RepID=G3HE58_CRIGR|nr:hypothetical protein I79_008832 [Cricetulus griseus]
MVLSAALYRPQPREGSSTQARGTPNLKTQLLNSFHHFPHAGVPLTSQGTGECEGRGEETHHHQPVSEAQILHFSLPH